MDQNNDNYISPKELRALILGIQIEGVNMDDLEEKVMKEFDISGDSNVTETEFIYGISKWLSESQKSASDQDQDRPKFFRSISKVNIITIYFKSLNRILKLCYHAKSLLIRPKSVNR
jgi:Ca2+-binding EF-hand superfamily protein